MAVAGGGRCRRGPRASRATPCTINPSARKPPAITSKAGDGPDLPRQPHREGRDREADRGGEQETADRGNRNPPPRGPDLRLDGGQPDRAKE